MNYIFGYDQAKLIEIGLNLEETCLLKYLQYKNGQETTYKQILKDLPILHIAEKQLSRLLDNIISKGLVSKIKTKYGFIIETRQKCLVLTSRVDKNVQSTPVESRHFCPLPYYIYNTIENINNYKRYTMCSNNGTSNIIELINKWHDDTCRDIFSLPSEGYNRIFEIDKLLSKIKESRIVINFPFKVVINKYDQIMADEFKDFTDNSSTKYFEKDMFKRKYIKEEIDTLDLFDNLDNISFD